MEMAIQQEFDSARQNFVAGNHGPAESICLEILNRVPDEPQVLALLGSIRHAMGHPLEGVRLVEQALQRAPGFADAHFSLGKMLASLGRTREAAECFQKTIELAPDIARAHVRLGAVVNDIGKSADAERHFRKAIEIDPADFLAYMAFGDLLLRENRFAEAVPMYQKALELGPVDDMAGTRLNLGAALKGGGHFADAMKYLETVNHSWSRSHMLECFLALERYDEFFDFIDANKQLDRADVRTAAISAYASQQLGRTDTHPFCPNPMQYIRVIDNIGMGDSEAPRRLISELIDAYDNFETVWAPTGNATTQGYQTRGNVFANPSGALAELKQLFFAEIEKYRQSLQSEKIVFAQEWPSQVDIHGWYVRLLTGGYEEAHIHPHGWLSGVVYLQVPKVENPDEGAIEFSLKSPLYATIGEDCPRKVHAPVVGQLILFPASIHHRTIPFSSDEERISLAFDLNPA